MKKASNQQDSLLNVKESLLSQDNKDLLHSNSLIRRTSYIPTPEHDSSGEQAFLKEMGYENGMIKKVYLFLKPNNIDEAIEIMSEVNGIYQHDYYESRSSSITNRCFICRKTKKYHRDYVEENEEHVMKSRSLLFTNKETETEQDISMNEVSIKEEKNEQLSSIVKNECLVCLEEFEESKGTKLSCGHFCCENCLFSYLKTEIESAKVAKIKCFIWNCENIISEDFILSKLSNEPKLTDKYKIFKQRANIFLDKNKKFCPEPDCNSYLQRGKNKYVQCENGHKYCYVCLKPWHGKTNCDEELDKDFQIWKKNKVVKQCPQCKIYTEKNEGCNHMTCTECKYQWCWLCEGQYQDGHFATGQCNGLQFAKINYLSEKPKIKPVRDYYPLFLNHSYNNNPYGEETGCCLCVSNIRKKLDFCGLLGPFGFYYGNKCLEFTVSFIIGYFFWLPVVVIRTFFTFPNEDSNRVTRNPIIRFFALLMSMMMFIIYQYYMTCVTVIYSIVTLPIPALVSFYHIIQDGNDSTFENYRNYRFN